MKNSFQSKSVACLNKKNRENNFKSFGYSRLKKFCILKILKVVTVMGVTEGGEKNGWESKNEKNKTGVQRQKKKRKKNFKEDPNISY